MPCFNGKGEHIDLPQSQEIIKAHFQSNLRAHRRISAAERTNHYFLTFMFP